MRKFTVMVTLLLSSGFAFAGQSSPSFVSVSQGVDHIDGSLVLQQVAVTQNITGKNPQPWTGFQQYATNVSGGSIVVQSATVNQSWIAPTAPFSTTPY
ncbi:MAG: hypothetical protein ACR650_15130 [Methylocystis sp.]|jgi:hypothetical protein